MMSFGKAENAETVVIIPAYEPPRTFIDYISLLSERGFREIVVVDDGSGEKYESVFGEIEKNGRVTLISYEVNRGKGHALKAAFSYCKNKFDESTVFVTADCDGQHVADDVERVARKAAANRGSLILGARDFSLECVPKRSKTGNLFTRKMFSLLYGISLSDTQTGLRAFSYALLEELISVRGERFEYEMNMLIVLHKRKIRIWEEPISTVYNTENAPDEKISHFRTVRDSLRVMASLFKNFGWYFLSSVSSALVEVIAFFVLTAVFLDIDFGIVALNMLIPTIGARILSSVCNFILNFKLVFGGKSKKSIFRYYLLWMVQLGLTYGFACLFTSVFEGLGLTTVATTALITLCKAACDLVVAAFSYQIQARWVFADSERRRTHFYGPYLRFWRVIYNIFVKKYRSFVVPPEREPCIYVCRHLDTHAPIKICQCIGFDLHFYVLNNFFGFRKVYRQYSTYTFTARYNRKGIKLFFAKIAAFFAALWFAPMVKSIKAIPVFRSGSETMITFKRSMEYLERGESIIVFPDVDYTADAEKPSDIYTGFLYLDKLYYRKHRRHISFVTLLVDDKKREIVETGRVAFSDGADFREDMPRVAGELHSILMNVNTENA